MRGSFVRANRDDNDLVFGYVWLVSGLLSGCLEGALETPHAASRTLAGCAHFLTIWTVGCLTISSKETYLGMTKPSICGSWDVGTSIKEVKRWQSALSPGREP